MNYTTKKFLEQIFGTDPLKFYSPVVGVWKNQYHRRIDYKLDIPGLNSVALSKFLWRLRKKKIVEYRESGDNIRIILTETGKKRVLSYKFDDLEIKKTKHWDQRWRLVAFDIPETKKRAREALVQKMKDLGLVQFQKSLWLYPYECKDEIDFVAEVFGVGKYVHYMVVSQTTNDNFLRQKFDLPNV